MDIYTLEEQMTQIKGRESDRGKKGVEESRVRV